MEPGTCLRFFIFFVSDLYLASFSVPTSRRLFFHPLAHTFSHSSLALLIALRDYSVLISTSPLLLSLFPISAYCSRHRLRLVPASHAPHISSPLRLLAQFCQTRQENRTVDFQQAQTGDSNMVSSSIIVLFCREVYFNCACTVVSRTTYNPRLLRQLSVTLSTCACYILVYFFQLCYGPQILCRPILHLYLRAPPLGFVAFMLLFLVATRPVIHLPVFFPA